MQKLLSILSCASLLLWGACSEDVEIQQEASPVNPGTAIRFSAHVNEGKINTRTVFGNQLSDKSFPVYWVDGDKVDVFSPEAKNNDGRKNKAVFTVNNPGSDNNQYVLSGEQETLYWGESDTHHFYAFYPAGNVENWEGGTDGSCTITANVPFTQVIKDADISREGGQHVRNDGTVVDCITACNMDYAIMATRLGTSVNRSDFQTGEEGAETLIPLNFDPITTAVNIFIYPSSSHSYQINSITIANAKEVANPLPLAGEFTYSIGNNADPGSVIATNPSYNIQVEFESPINLGMDGDTRPLKLTVFLLPNAAANLKVSLNGEKTTANADGSHSHVLITKSTATNASERLTANAVNTMNLGALPAEASEITSEIWQSALPNSAYVSQLSIPGAYDAANFVNKITGDDRAQTKLYSGNDDDANRYYNQMAAYLNGGIRAFDLKLSYSEDESKYPGHWYTNRQANLGQSPEAVNFAHFVEAGIYWLRQHTTEFLVVFLSDYEAGNSTSATDNYRTHATELISRIPEGYLLTDFDANVTVGEARGKILVINGHPVDNPIGLTVNGWEHNNKNSRTESNERDGQLCSMGNGNIFIHDYNNLYHWTSGFLGLTQNYDWVNKHTYLENALKSCRDDQNVNDWYYIAACARYYATTFDVVYSDAMSDSSDPSNNQSGTGNLRRQIKNWLSGLSNNGTYEKCGMVMMAYVCTEERDGSNTVERLIWNNNYKAPVPLHHPGGH